MSDILGRLLDNVLEERGLESYKVINLKEDDILTIKQTDNLLEKVSKMKAQRVIKELKESPDDINFYILDNGEYIKLDKIFLNIKNSADGHKWSLFAIKEKKAIKND